MMRAKSLSAIALLAVVPLAACGSSKAASQATSAATNAASAATNAASAATGGSSASQSPSASASVPAGDKMITDTPAKVQFAVPSTWVSVDAKTMKSPSVRKAMEPLAKRNGKTVDEVLQQFLQDADVYVMAPAATDNGYTDNLSALKPRSTSDLDGAATGIKQSLEQQGATVSKQSHVQSALGDGLLTDYTMSVSGKTFHGASLLMPTPDGSLVPLTVSAGTADQADKFAQDVAKTYRAA